MAAGEEVTLDIKGFHKKGRYAVTQKGYVFDRYYFRLLSVLVIIIMAAAFIHLGGLKQYAYASCPVDAEGGACNNPLYGACDKPACNVETLRPGQTIGERPPSISTPLIFVFFFTALIFFLNHLEQNTKAYEVARNERFKDSSKDKERARSIREVPSRKR